MKINIKKKVFSIIMMIILTFSVGILLSGDENAYAKSSSMISLKKGQEIKLNTDDLEVEVKFGFEGYSKYSSYMRIQFLAQNSGNDFSGKFRVEYPTYADEKLAMLARNVAIASGEKKKVEIVLPVMESTSYKVSICDEEGNMLAKKNVNVEGCCNLEDQMLFVGELSDDTSGLQYINNAFMGNSKTDSFEADKVFELSAEDISDDFRSFDTLDIIIINDFNTSVFTEKQINALKEWVESGGMLLLGTGANADKVLKGFSGNILSGKIGAAKTIATNFGMSKDEVTLLSGEADVEDKVNIDITSLDIEKSKAVLADSEEKLLSSVALGDGKIYIAEYSLNLPDKMWNTYGAAVAEVLKKEQSSLVDKNGNYRGMNAQVYSYSYIDDVLNINSADSLPNLKLYGAILIIYVILVGPAAYIYYRKKDKRGLLWVFVPVTAVVFSVMIYIIGTSTRIQKPYINYASVMNLSEEEKDTNRLDTVFSVASSSNKPYSMTVNSDISVFPMKRNNGYYGVDEGTLNQSDYKYGIEYGSDSTKLLMNRLSSFEAVKFEMAHNASGHGNVDIKLDKEGSKIKGTLTNNMSYSLNKCIIYDNGKVYYLGDIAAGDTVDISKLSSSDIFDSSQYGYDGEAAIEAAYGTSFYGPANSDYDMRRKIGMLIDYYQFHSVQTWFYGFAEEGEETGFTDNFSYKKYGNTAVCKLLNIKAKADGHDIIGNLSKYAYIYDDIKTNGDIIYDTTSAAYEVTYRFPYNFVPKQLIYNADTVDGREFTLGTNGFATEAFIGKAMLRNKKTGELDEIIESGKETVVKGIDKYLNDDGTLTIHYNLSHNTNYEVDSYILPRAEIAGDYVED